MQRNGCGYHNKKNGVCDLCGFQMTEPVAVQPKKYVKIYRIPRQSMKGKKRQGKRILSFYKTEYNYSDKKCEECGLQLPEEWSPYFISHILTKAAYRRCRWDTRNYNILCLECHVFWETKDRTKMKIYPKNLETIMLLKYEYYGNENYYK